MKLFLLFPLLLLANCTLSQNFTFNYNANGYRVCLVESEVDLNVPSVKIKLLDHAQNTSFTSDIYRRPTYGTGNDWVLVAPNLPIGTTQWIDTNVNLGEIWEYKVKRKNAWIFNSQTYDAVGYSVGTILKDNSNYRGQMIVLVTNDVVNSLNTKYLRLKRELTGEGWFVNEVIVPKAHTWYSGDTVVGIRNQIKTIYNNAPISDKPKALFILGHVPMPRSGSTLITAPDAHDQNKGARGFDGFYADIDGIYSDTATFNPGGLQIQEAINYPGDFKWDQDFFSSDVEMAFGRVDFYNINEYNLSEMEMIERYLDKISNYKNVANGFEMGEKSAFKFGYNNSNDGTYRTLPSISKAENVFENTVGGIHPQWVQNNGPFKIYMQNQSVPEISEWETYGMDATVFSSDQSYWGYNDCPQTGVYGRIRALLASNTKCIVTLWTTSTINTFFQACSGDPLSFAIKEKINHNTTNKNVETPQSQWDTQDWWNRTHLSFNGDPTIQLFQVKPASNLSISATNGQATLAWTASLDTSVLGYNIYKSNAEFGIYAKANTNLITNLSFVANNYQQNDWFMVRAVKKIESGCGQFLQASNGKFIQGQFNLQVNDIQPEAKINIYPNPSSYSFRIESESEINSVELISMNGAIVYSQKEVNSNSFNADVANLNSGVYVVLIKMNEVVVRRKMVVE